MNFDTLPPMFTKQETDKFAADFEARHGSLLPPRETCACTDDYHGACMGESFPCDCCGVRSDDPHPYAERYSERTTFYYCAPCAAEYLKDGDIIRDTKTGNVVEVMP